MSTWKNILTDPPAPGTGIRVTDGKSVFVGHIMQNVPWFTGVSMDDGSEITISADLLTEWMPLAAPEKEKAADEMFRELGFTKIEKPRFYAEYIRLGEYSCKIVVRDCGNMLDFEVECGDSFAASLSGPEIAACNQLSKEWEEQK